VFKGTYTALVTPHKNGAIDFKAFEVLLERQIAGKVEGVVPAGCTGEAATMTPEEQLELIRFTVEIVKGRVQILAGTGSNNTREAVQLSEQASQMKIQGVMVISPYYNKPTQRGLIAHFSAIADASRVPVMIYNVPGRTGVKIEPETVAELGKHPNITAIKEACGSLEQVSEIVSLSDIEVLSGDDSLALPMISVGAKGVVSVSANIAPLQVSETIRLALNNNFTAARKNHLDLLKLHKSMFVESNPIPVKTVLGEMGLIAKELRLPLQYGNSSTVEMAKKLIQSFNLQP